jgi:hypothetical protein
VDANQHALLGYVPPAADGVTNPVSKIQGPASTMR